MAPNRSNQTSAVWLVSIAGLVSLVAPTAVSASPAAAVVQNPNFNPRPTGYVIDLSPTADNDRPLVDKPYPPAPRFDDLDAHAGAAPQADPHAQREGLPDGLVQEGSMVLPEAMLNGAEMVGDAGFSLTAGSRPQRGSDLAEICAYPEEVPAGIYDYEHRPGGETPRFGTVYLNYQGGVLQGGSENSAENQSTIARSGHPFPTFAGGEAKAIAAAQAVQADFADFAIRVVYVDRPPKVLPYTMVMIGGSYTDTTAGPSGGVAPLDCEDFGQRNVCYAFGGSQSATSIANVASQEIGHTYGLGHTNARDSVMAAGYAQTNGGDLGLNDTCADAINVAGQGSACAGVNKCHCGDRDAQHDKNTLLATFAPAGVDMVEPTIELLSPADGSVFETGSDITIELDPWDDVGGYGWKLIVENEAGEVLVDQVDYDRALVFTLTQVPVGEYTLTGLIQDHADHVTTHSISVSVVPAEGGSESGGLDDSGGSDGSDGDSGGGDAAGDPNTDDSGSGSAGDDGSDSGGTSDSAGAGAEAGDDGCGCTTVGKPSIASLFLGLFALGLRRRRARA